MTPARVLGLVKDILQYPLFTVSETTVTLTSLFLIVALMVGFIFMSRLLSKSVLTRVLARTKLDEGIQYTFTRFAHYLILTFGAIISFQIIGIDLSGLVVLFGFLSVGIGFGLQNITSNFISGLILLLERPIKVGDRVMVGDTEGDVEEIRMRATVVRTPNNVSIIVPNSEFISGHVVNWSHFDPKVRLDIRVGVAYDSDLDLVLGALHEVAREESAVLDTPEPEVLLLEFGDSSWNMELRVWIDDPKRHWHVRSAVNCAIVTKFRENNIEIPFPQQDVHVRSPLPVPVVNDHKEAKNSKS